MAKMKLVYDPGTMASATFKEGWAIGVKSAKAGMLDWRPRWGLMGYWTAVWLVFIFTLGLGMVFRLQQAMAGAMRYEQLLMAGREPKFSDAWRVFVKGGPLTKMSALLVLSLLALGAMSQMPWIGFLLHLALSPLVIGAWSMAAWRSEIQGESFGEAVGAIPDMVKKGWGAMLGMWCPLALCCMAGWAAAVAMGVGAYAAGNRLGMEAGLGMGALAVVFFLAVMAALSMGQAAVCGMGYHLLGRAMMMKKVDASGEPHHSSARAGDGGNGGE